MNLRQRFDSVRQDGRQSLRLMWRSPLFFGAAILTLGLGIGVNGTVFSILQSILLQKLPYEDEARLVLLSHRSASNKVHDEFSGPMAISVREAAANQLGDVGAAIVMHSGGQMGAVQGDNLQSAFDATIAERVVRWSGASVTPNFFRLLGARAAKGHLFVEGDDGLNESSVVLSHQTWLRDFDGDPNIIGRSVSISSGMPRVRRVFTVIGVLQRNVHFTYPTEVEAWLATPWSAVAASNPYAVGEFLLVSRIRRGMSLSQAHQVLSLMPRPRIVGPSNAQSGPNERIEFRTMRDWVLGDVRPSLYLLGAVALLLLVVTCVTVSNGLLARISERQQEIAVRASLGADRSRIVQQLIVEGAILAGVGTIVGVFFAILAQPFLQALVPSSLPRVGDIGVSYSIIMFGAVTACVTTMLSAVAPAVIGVRQAATASLIRAAVGGSAGQGAVRWRQILVGAQAALTTALLIVSALLLVSFWRLGRVPLGFDAGNVIAIDLQLLDSKYRDPGATANFQVELLRRVRGLAGVTAAGITSAMPFRGFDSPARLTLPNSEQKFDFKVRYVDSSFFSTLKVSVVRGRLLSEADRQGTSEVAVLSESFARSVFGNDDPIGKTVRLANETQVVGIVRDLRYAGLKSDPSPAVYVPASQHSRQLFTLSLRVASSDVRRGVLDGVHRELRAVDPEIPALRVAMLEQIIEQTILNRRFYSVATASFAILALVLTGFGLALVVARAVGERQRELAIRSALGASQLRIASAAVGDAMVAVAAGVGVGLAIAGASAVLLSQFLFQTKAVSPTVFAGVSLLVALVALAASWVPLQRVRTTPLAQTLRMN